jgi:HEAT repeat protein
MTAAERRRQVVLAGHLGDEDTARRASHDADPKVRAGALGALERLGRLDDVTVAEALTDPDALVRRRAAQIAAHHPDVALLRLLSDADASVVEMAAFACGEHERADPAVIARLSELATQHRDALVREAAVAALGAIGHPDGLPAILSGTHDKPAVRHRAVIALAPFDGPEVDAALAEALQDRDWQVRQAAEDLDGPHGE